MPFTDGRLTLGISGASFFRSPRQQAEMFRQPLIFTTFCSTESNAYVGVADSARLKSVLDSKLQEYNESNAMMDLVLFDQAMVSVLSIMNYIGVHTTNAS